MKRALDPPQFSSPKRQRTSSCSNYSLRTAYSSPLPSSSTYTPSDSPTNPFGFKRTQYVTDSLPPVSSFGKHLPLRFQLVECVPTRSVITRTNALKGQRKPDETSTEGPDHEGLRSARKHRTIRRDSQGVFRIVQVPLNYTFLHFRRLIHFLFGGWHEEVLEEGDESDIGGPSNYTRKRRRSSEFGRKTSCRVNGHGRRRGSQGEDFNPGHLFEVMKGLALYPSTQKAGEIKDGETWAKLSDALDPLCAYRTDDWDDEGDIRSIGRSDKLLCYGNGCEIAERDGTDAEAEEDGDWTWQPEDDYTLWHVWPKGCKYHDRGIIYHHSPRKQVHVTVCMTNVEHRKGKGNIPFVFKARGLVRLEGIWPLVTQKAKDTSFESKLFSHQVNNVEGDEDAEGETDHDHVPMQQGQNRKGRRPSSMLRKRHLRRPSADDEVFTSRDGFELEEEFAENHTAALRAGAYNDPDAFPSYYAQVARIDSASRRRRAWKKADARHKLLNETDTEDQPALSSSPLSACLPYIHGNSSQTELTLALESTSSARSSPPLLTPSSSFTSTISSSPFTSSPAFSSTSLTSISSIMSSPSQLVHGGGRFKPPSLSRLYLPTPFPATSKYIKKSMERVRKRMQRTAKKLAKAETALAKRQVRAAQRNSGGKKVEIFEAAEEELCKSDAEDDEVDQVDELVDDNEPSVKQEGSS